MTSNRRIALAAGVLFIITFITSIPALYLFEPVLRDPAGYIAGSGADNTRILVGASLELFLIVANVATRRRPLSDPQAAERDACARLRHGPSRRVQLHRHRPRQRAWRGEPAAAGRERRGRRHDRRGARRDQGLDVPARPRLRRRHRQRDAARLPDVPIRPGAAPHGRAGTGRRAADLPLGDPRTGRRLRGGRHRRRAIATAPEFLWELSLGIWLTVKGFNASPILPPESGRARPAGPSATMLAVGGLTGLSRRSPPPRRRAGRSPRRTSRRRPPRSRASGRRGRCRAGSRPAARPSR